MNLHTLPKITETKKKRLGRGHGSGRVKTSGRGTKGQKARTRIPLEFEGGALRLIKRLPFLRGKGKNRVFQKKALVIPTTVLNLLPQKSVVDIETLIKHKIVDARDAKIYGVKILGGEDLSKAFTVKLPVSGGAKKKIEAAGGTIAL